MMELKKYLADRAKIVDGYLIVPGPGTYNVGLYNQSPSGTVSVINEDIFVASATGAEYAISFFNGSLAVGAGHVVSITGSNIVSHQVLNISLLSASGSSSSKYQVACQYIMDDDQGL